MPRRSFDFNTTEAAIDADGDITVTRGSGGGRLESSGLYSWKAVNNSARIDHTIGGVFRGLLVEPKRTNAFQPNHNLDFSEPTIGNVSLSNITVTKNAAVGVDGNFSAARFDMAGNNDRWAQTGWLPDLGDDIFGVCSFYGQRNGFPEDIALAYFKGGSSQTTKYPTPATGIDRITWTDRTANFASPDDIFYWMVQRTHPDGAGNGPDSFLGHFFQMEFASRGDEMLASSYIPTSGSVASREADIYELAVPSGRYNIAVRGEQKSHLYCNQLVENNTWVLRHNPMDFHVQGVDFYLHDEAIPGGPTIVRKTIGLGGDYADWAAAQAALPADLVALNEAWWLVQLPGTQATSGQVTLTTVTDSMHPLIVSSAEFGEPSTNNRSFWYTTQNRTRLTRGTGQAMRINADYAQVYDMKIQGLTFGNATNPGDAATSHAIIRNCIFDRFVDRNTNGGAFLEVVNSLFFGFQNTGFLSIGGTDYGNVFHCTAIRASTAGTSAVHDGFSSGSKFNCIAANYFTNSGIRFGYTENSASTDGSGTPAALESLTYAQIFENAYPDPTPATGLKALGTGRFFAEAQLDVRGLARPIAGSTHIGCMNDQAGGDVSFASLASGIPARTGRVVNLNFQASVALFNGATHSGEGGTATRQYDNDWNAQAIVQRAGGFLISGHGGGHNGYLGVETYTFDTDTRLWDVTQPQAKPRILGVDPTFGSDLVEPDPAQSAEPGWPDSSIPSHWRIRKGVPQAHHLYGGDGAGNGNPAWFQGVGSTLGFLLFVGSSFGSDGNGAYGRRPSYRNLDTKQWVLGTDDGTDGSAQNAIQYDALGNGGKAFVDTDTNTFWFISANNIVLKALLNNPIGSQFQTGIGRNPNVWYNLSGNAPQRTGLDGGACWWPGNQKAVMFAPSGEVGDPWVWCDTSGTNPVLSAFTPTGDVPNDGETDGGTMVWHPTFNKMFFYTGQKLFEFDPATEVFTNVTPSQLGVDLAPFPNMELHTAPAKARLGVYLDLLVMAGKSTGDVWLYNPADPTLPELDMATEAEAAFDVTTALVIEVENAAEAEAAFDVLAESGVALELAFDLETAIDVSAAVEQVLETAADNEIAFNVIERIIELATEADVALILPQPIGEIDLAVESEISISFSQPVAIDLGVALDNEAARDVVVDKILIRWTPEAPLADGWTPEEPLT